MVTRMCRDLCLLPLLVVLASVPDASASSMTWTYEGAALGFPPSPIPAGTLVTFSVTVDPAHNILVPATVQPFYPFMGAYLTTVSADMAGVRYTVPGALEVNGDPNFTGSPFFGKPLPGFTAFREFSESTDHGFFLGGSSPPPTLTYVDEPNTDPNSPALLMPFPMFNLVLFIAPTAEDLFAPRVNISGHLVPEPFSGTLLAVGIAAAALRRRLGRAGQHKHV